MDIACERIVCEADTEGDINGVADIDVTRAACATIYVLMILTVAWG